MYAESNLRRGFGCQDTTLRQTWSASFIRPKSLTRAKCAGSKGLSRGSHMGGKRRDLALVSRKNTSVENGVLGVLKFGHTHGHGGTLDIFTLLP